MSELCALLLQGAEGKSKLEYYHPMIEGFSRYLEDFKKSSTDVVQSNMRIQLPFEVEPDVTEEILAWDHHAQRVLFVTCMAPERNYIKKSRRRAVKRMRMSEMIHTKQQCTQKDRSQSGPTSTVTTLMNSTVD